jgi:glycosyltransferase involved in cell wall biosynthesis
MIDRSNPRASQSLLGLFPNWDESGGVQCSGKIAWEGIACKQSRLSDSQFGNLYLFRYGEHKQNGKGAVSEREKISCLPAGDFADLMFESKFAAILAATRWRPRIETVLIWHLALLRLLPFFRLQDARIVLFLHGIEAWRRQDWLTRKLLGAVDLFLSNSDYTWSRFVSTHLEFASTAHRSLHLGIGAPSKAAIPRPVCPPAVLMISRLLRSEDYKGHRTVIAAWPLVLKRIPDAELWIAGEGDLRQDLEITAKNLGLANQVRFWGKISEDEKEALLTRCSCLALPSRAEGFGLVYLEAMRMGRPCLVSTIDAGREVVNPPQAGIAANPDDPQELANSVCRLLSDGAEWELWSTQARRRYEEYFTAEHFQQRLLSALMELPTISAKAL